MSTAETSSNPPGQAHYWLWVLCLLGLDYFSTLAYQPSITYHETKLLGPLATAAVVLVTLFGALPVYCYLAGRSPGGKGSLGIIETLIRGWRGKTLVLILLGFAATDFTMLKALSLADASVHVLNQQDHERLTYARQFVQWLRQCVSDYCGNELADQVNEQLAVTILLGIITYFYWFFLRKGFSRKMLYLTVPLIGLYMLLTGIVIAAGLWHLYQHPDIFWGWLDQVRRGDPRMQLAGPVEDQWGVVILHTLLALPTLALGLSGFEMSMILIPQVEGAPGASPEQDLQARIWNTRKVLITSALIMSLFLIGAVLVTTLLIPADQYQPDGHANNRALSYLAHGGALTTPDSLAPFCGPVFGTFYDIITVLVLCLAGTSVMTALGALLPQFLLRFGMEFRWTQRWGVLLMLFGGINLAVTMWFQANVEDQRGAYATGVLVLIACAAVVTLLDKRRERETRGRWNVLSLIDFAFHTLVAAVLVTTMLAVAMRSASGLAIALCFIVAIVAMSVLSRAWRADELRTVGFDFKDEQSKFLWNNLRLMDFPVLVPVRPGRESREQKEAEIRAEHHLSAEADIVFLEVCVDDPSDFFQHLKIEVTRENLPSPAARGAGGEGQGYRYVIRVTNGASAAHVIAAIALEMSRHSAPPGLHFGWPELNMLASSWSYLAFGEGNIPWKVRELIHHAEKDPAKRPRVIVG